MAEPWIKKSANDVLTSDDWNNLQVNMREQLEALAARVSQSLTQLDQRVTQLQGMIFKATGSSPAPAPAPPTTFNVRGETFDSGLWLSNSNRWTEISEGQLHLSLAVTSLVRLRAEAHVSLSSSHSFPIKALFVLKQGNKSAPARLNPRLPQNSYSNPNPNYVWPGEPSAATWSAWLDYHTANAWPVGSPGRTLIRSGYNYTSPLYMNETVELPPGEYDVRVAYFLDVGQSYFNYQDAPFLRNLTLRATIIPA